MAKLNKAGAMKKASMAKQYTNGCMITGSHSANMDSGGRFLTPYEIGCQDWQNGTPYSKLWHIHRQQGYKKSRDRDILFAMQCPSAEARVSARLGL